jgi:signal transduction histidine kinase
MKNKIFTSLRIGVLVAIVLVIIMVPALVAYFFVKTYKESHESSLKSKAEIFAKDLSASYGQYLLSTNQQKNLNYLAQKAIAEEEDVVSVQVFNKDFVEVVATTQSINPDIKFMVDKKAKFDNINERATIVHKFKENTKFFEVVLPIFTLKKIEEISNVGKINSSQLKEVIGAVRIIVSFARSDKEVSRVSRIIVIICIVVIILGLGLSLLMVRIILNPMQDALDKSLQDLSDEKDKLFNNKIHLEGVISKMKIMQEELLESERFSTIGKLAAVLAHELRNPLTSLQNIMFYFSQIKDFSDEESAKMLKMFFEESSRSGRILSDLLDFARLDSIHKTAVYVDEVVHRVMVEACLPKNIEIRENFDRIEAYVDASKLSQALRHLIINAKDSMREGGIIDISVKNSAGFVEIKVKDTGIGIKEGDIKNIWSPFFTTKSKSMGIGLSIVKKIVDLHSGSILVTSEENKGTEFTITFPLFNGDEDKWLI